jgi:murein hydrolase activator
MQRSRRNVALCTLGMWALWFGVARGERSPSSGIGADIEVARALAQVESESAKQTRLQTELSALDARRFQLQGALKQRVRALYRISRSGMAPLGGGFEAMRLHVARVRRLRALVQNDQKAYAAALARAKVAREENALAQSSLSQARQRLDALQNEQRLPHFEEPDRETSINSARSGSGFYGLRFTDEPLQPPRRSDFEAQRGKLAAPVTGEVRVLDARRAESDGPGLEFQAAAGTPVRAAAAGRVAFSDRYGSYGRLVILDHGGTYYTAYGGLGELDVQVGDDVSPYARLGSIGDGAEQPALFFEVRKGTRALPPRAWLGL